MFAITKKKAKEVWASSSTLSPLRSEKIKIGWQKSMLQIQIGDRISLELVNSNRSFKLGSPFCTYGAEIFS
jgi:hypothetical protein